MFMCSFFRRVSTVVLASLLPLGACGDDGGAVSGFDGGLDTGADTAVDGSDGGPPGGVGDPCDDTSSCREPLVCDGETSTCQPSGTTEEGGDCVFTGDCADGLYCGPRRTCAPAGTGAEGAECTSTGDCEGGLVCTVTGFFATCGAAGDGDLGDVCDGPGACLAGLTCASPPGADEVVCLSPAPVDVDRLPPPIPLWSGAECGSDVGSPVAYFQVPRGTSEDGDFFQLPFPNDIRRSTEGLDLSGFPTPGTAAPVDVIGRYVTAAEEDLRGFATNAVGYFRFSVPHDWESTEGNIRIVNVDAGSASFGENHPSLAWLNTAGPISRYICPNWLGIRPGHGVPLLPGTTYAYVLSTGIIPDAGGTYARAGDFEAMLSDTEPTDADLADAWGSYAPLRAWIADSGTDPDTILNAAVFTTQEPEPMVPALREVIRAGALPTVSDLTACDADVTSPCDDGTALRACEAASGDFVEIHGRIDLPIFQEGTAPYLAPEDGGDIVVDGGGMPQVARSEAVCFGLTVPTTAMPDGGWPLLLYGHGTGGSFRGAVRSELASTVATGATPAATLAIDLPQHGARRGESTDAPASLFFNFANPPAARDNVLQGTADLLSLVRFAGAVTIEAGDSPTGEEIRFDASTLAMFVHSQGATHAALMVPYEPDVRAVVLSGNGGDLTQSLLHKTEPVDIAGILPFALLDPNSNGGLAAGDFHPALALFQTFFERVDTVNYAYRLHRDPVPGDTGRHVFMTYGLGDSYSPEATMQAYARAARMTLVEPVLTGDAFGLTAVAAPLVANRSVGGSMWTIGMRQYAPTDDEDGHFVATRTTAGRADALRFMETALGGGDPPIGQ